MQAHLAGLHLDYNLTGLTEPTAVLNALFHVNQARIRRDDDDDGVRRDDIPRPPIANPAGDVRCHPPDLLVQQSRNLDDEGWVFVCDLCGHLVVHARHFCWHMQKGAGRAKFKIINIDTDIAMEWYAKDRLGNEYRGDMIPAAEREQTTAPKGTQIGLPCGPWIRADGAARTQRRKQKDAERNAEERMAEEAEAPGEDETNRLMGGEPREGDDEEAEEQEEPFAWLDPSLANYDTANRDTEEDDEMLL